VTVKGRSNQRPTETAVVTPDGRIEIYGKETGDLVGRISAPWAYDANGVAVPTSYSIDGSAPVQTIEHSVTSAYPVVAAPCWSCIAAQAIGIVVTVTALAGACAVVCTIAGAFAVAWGFGRWVQGNYRSCEKVSTRNQAKAARAKPNLYKYPSPWRRNYYGCRGWRVAPNIY